MLGWAFWPGSALVKSERPRARGSSLIAGSSPQAPAASSAAACRTSNRGAIRIELGQTAMNRPPSGRVEPRLFGASNHYATTRPSRRPGGGGFTRPARVPARRVGAYSGRPRHGRRDAVVVGTSAPGGPTQNPSGRGLAGRMVTGVMGQRVVLAIMALAVQAAAGGCETGDGRQPDGGAQTCPNRGPAGCAEGYRLSGETCACVPDGDAAADVTTDGSPPVDQAASDVVSAEEAEFQALTVGLGGGPCPTDQSCGGSIVLRRDGTMVHEYRGERFEGRVTGAELDVLVPLVSDARTIEELRKAPGCPPAIHATELAVVEIVPGIFVSGDISGCIEGPLAAFRYHLHAVTKRLFPQSPFAIGLVVVLPNRDHAFACPNSPCSEGSRCIGSGGHVRPLGRVRGATGSHAGRRARLATRRQSPRRVARRRRLRTAELRGSVAEGDRRAAEAGSLPDGH